MSIPGPLCDFQGYLAANLQRYMAETSQTPTRRRSQRRLRFNSFKRARRQGAWQPDQDAPMTRASRAVSTTSRVIASNSLSSRTRWI